MRFKEVLLPQKLDLDVMLLTLFAGVDADQEKVRFVGGSASGMALKDPSVLCVECGGAGDTENNNFDHHSPAGQSTGSQLSAAAQFFERVARLFRYVDDVDCGEFERVKKPIGFPSLLQLVSGMQMVVKDPSECLKHGHEILRAVLRSGIDPYTENMESILDAIPGAREWATAKKLHEEHFVEMFKAARWCQTNGGKKLAAIETTWIGAPGALYGYGADIVVALNPCRELADGRSVRKFTVSIRKEMGVSLRPALDVLEQIEIERSGKGGWGGPNHGTIIGSPQDQSSALSIEEVIEVVQKIL